MVRLETAPTVQKIRQIGLIGYKLYFDLGAWSAVSVYDFKRLGNRSYRVVNIT